MTQHVRNEHGLPLADDGEADEGGDGAVIDGAINGVAMVITPAVTAAVRRAQSGYVFRYASVMILGIAAVVTWILIGGFR